MTMTQRIEGRELEVAIVGASGQMGSRLTGMVNEQPDMRTTLAVVKDGHSTHGRLAALRAANPETRFDYNHEDLSILAQEAVDIVVDTKPPRSGVVAIYRLMDKPVIVQSGEREVEAVIAVPGAFRRNRENLYREGDCNVVGSAPVLSALSPYIQGPVSMDVLMQFGRSLNDKPRDNRLHATYITPGDELQQDIHKVFPNLDVRVRQILEVPGLRYYIQTFEFDTKEPMDNHQLIKVLNNHPRISCFTGVGDTFQINEAAGMMERRGGNLMPVVPLFPLKDHGPRTHHILNVAIDSRRITPTANLDTLRVVGLDVEPLEAMRQTDAALGLRRLPLS